MIASGQRKLLHGWVILVIEEHLCSELRCAESKWSSALAAPPGAVADVSLMLRSISYEKRIRLKQFLQRSVLHSMFFTSSIKVFVLQASLPIFFLFNYVFL